MVVLAWSLVSESPNIPLSSSLGNLHTKTKNQSHRIICIELNQHRSKLVCIKTIQLLSKNNEHNININKWREANYSHLISQWNIATMMPIVDPPPIPCSQLFLVSLHFDNISLHKNFLPSPLDLYSVYWIAIGYKIHKSWWWY